jgi:hypothetical protein
MRKCLLSLILVLLPTFALGQTVDLKVTGGEPKVVQTKLPFSVDAPTGGFNYQWNYPSGLTCKAKGSSLQVSAGPVGTYTVSVLYSVIDFDKKSVQDNYGEITLNIGQVSPPTPDPVVPQELVSALTTGLFADGGKTTANVAALKKLAAAAQAVANNSDNASMISVGDAFTYWATQIKAQGLTTADLPKTKLGWGSYANVRLKAASADPLTPAFRQQLRAEFTNLANALNQLAITKYH